MVDDLDIINVGIRIKNTGDDEALRLWAASNAHDIVELLRLNLRRPSALRSVRNKLANIITLIEEAERTISDQ